MNGSGRRVLIIGLDGGTFCVLRPLAEAGLMPNIARAMADGFAAPLRSTVPFVTAPAWTSFMTGKNPGKHGVFDFRVYDPRTHSDHLVTSRSIQSKTMWQILSEKGKQVCVLHLPLMFPPQPVNGVIVPGFDAPMGEGAFTYPAELSDEIRTRLADYDFLRAAARPRFAGNEEAEFHGFVDEIRETYHQVTELAIFVLGKFAWDVGMVQYQHVDWMQHRVWNEIEAACRDGAPDSGRLGAIRRAYSELDRQIGRLLAAAATAEVTVLFVSDHGFGTHEATVFPNYYLRQWGYLVTEGSSRAPVVARALGGASRLVRRVTGRKPAGTPRPRVPWYERQERSRDLGERLGIRWSETQVAMTTSDQAALLYVNVKGRDAEGVVEPGADHERLLTELVERFREVRAPGGREALFPEILRGRELYVAGDGAVLPDLVLIPRDGFSVSREIPDRPMAPPKYPGTHRRDGIVIAAGPGVDRHDGALTPRIEDIAPTVLALVDVPVPSDMDGRVIPAIAGHGRDVAYEVADNRVETTAGPTLSEDDEEIIKERLRALGYLS